MSNWALVIATFALVALTAWYALQTRNMARAASLQAEESSRPLVTVRDVTRYSGIFAEFHLRIANDGRSPALGVTFGVAPDVTIKRGRERPLSTFPLLASGVEALPAGSEHFIYLGYWEHIATKKFTVTCSYRSATKAYAESHPIDLTVHEGAIPRPRTMAEAIEHAVETWRSDQSFRDMAGRMASRLGPARPPEGTDDQGPAAQ